MKKRLTAVFLLLSMLLTAMSCGSGSGDTTDTNAPEDGTGDAAAAEEYDYPEYDGGGSDFSILNASNTWGFYTTIDFEERTGDNLDEAVYTRNRFIEDKFKVNFAVTEADIQTVHEKYQTSILSQDYEYDAAFIPTINMTACITEGYLHNLLDYSEFRLDEEYYDQSVNTAARVGSADVQYFASNFIGFTGLDGALCMFFNESMMEDFNVESPYTLVSQGKWTLDKFGEYNALGANLNGDESYAWNESGSSVYGMASWQDGFGAFIAGAGVNFVALDSSNQPEFKAEERLYDVLDKIDGIFKPDGAYISQNGSGNSHYETIFKNGRALFLLAELKASSLYRDMNDSFGLLPLPKADETQDNYSSYRSRFELLMSVPVTCPDPARSGIILDALAYKSYADVLPVYYDSRLAQKQLRGDDSALEMLEIIRSTLNFDTGFPYGWTFDLYTALSRAIANKSGGYASTVASHETRIKTAIEDTMELLNK